MQLEAALATDIAVARDILSKRLGEILVEEKDDGVYAQMDIGAVLLEAVGADVAGSGCGGTQLLLSTPHNQDLTALVTIRLGDHMTRRAHSAVVLVLAPRG